MRPEILFPLFADVQTLTGVGEKVSEALGRVAGRRLKDLIFTPPSGLIDRSQETTIAGAADGEIVTLKITVDVHRPGNSRKAPYRIVVSDETGEMTLTYFHARGDYLKRILAEGQSYWISGKIERYRTETQMTHPDYVVAETLRSDIPGFEPLYPLTAGLSQKVMRKSVVEALKKLPEFPEWQDKPLMAENDWPKFSEAVLRMHNPESRLDSLASGNSRKRLAYDEIFAKQLAIALVRESSRKASGRVLSVTGEYVDEVIAGAAFVPTNAQMRAFSEIRADLESPFRMARLLQGDVGAGKTFVAALTAAHCAEAKLQVAIMAPTEILARQHAETLTALLEPANLTVAALTGRDKGKPREAILTGLRDGYIDVICGTHALFQDSVEFHNLGVVVIDEQHRFGVNDRMRLTLKGQRPDVLVMTATPIPRTLALSSYGDLDISILDEKPAGRRPIDTRILPMSKLDDIIDGVGRAVAQGGKAYWVCPLVEESELVDLSSADDRHRQLQAIFGDRVGLLHGRMNAQDKEAIAEAFKRGEYDILVATTVIEVGVDAPDATIMVIEHAERFGLAQLHQLRGRVGRSDKPSSCLLLYKGPLSVNGKARLETMRSTEDGFVIAEKDWELRGSGDLLGSRQSGLPKFRLADLDKHKALLEIAVKDARALAMTDPGLTTPRGEAARVLLYLFEQDYGIALMKAG